MVRSGKNKVAVILHWSCSLLLVSLSVYLVVLAFTGGFTLFSLHPIGMAIAVRRDFLSFTSECLVITILSVLVPGALPPGDHLL